MKHLRNPFGRSTKDLLETGGWAIVGGVATRAVPENLLSKYNSGAIGYGLNIVTAFGGAWLVGMVLGAESAFGFAVGGVVMTAGRIVQDVFGKTVVQFSMPFGTAAGATTAAAAVPATSAVPTGTSGLGRFGDPGFNLGKYVKNYGFPLPWAPAKNGSKALPAASSSTSTTGPASSAMTKTNAGRFSRQSAAIQ